MHYPVQARVAEMADTRARRRYGIVCWAHNEQSVCLSYGRQQVWYAIWHDVDGLGPCALVNGVRYRIGALEAYPAA